MNRASRFAGIGCGLFLLIGICTTSLSCYVCVPMPARDAAQGFLSDIRSRAWPSALQRTSADYQTRHTEVSLQQAVSRAPRLEQHTGATFYNGTVDGETAVLDGTIDTPDGAVPIGVELVLYEGYWYVDQLVIQGVPLE